MTRVAIVTASDSGIGKTTALMLAERGFDIGVTWHSDEKGALETCREVEAPFLEMPFDDWRNIFTVDVDGAFLCSQIAARQMVKQGEGGRIVNITSVHEHTPLPEASAYTAAKHALGGLTKSMAMELVKHNILVNAVAPGAIATPMNDMDDSEVKEGSMPEIPLARPGHTREIASLVAWLCDSDASYTTGQSFIVDGGFMLANPQFKPEG